MNILSIQSWVAYGHVGNASAVFPLQRLGAEVWAVNTVQFSNHTGYGSWRGQVFGADLVRDLVQGIEDRGALPRCDAVLSGYMGDAAIGEAILDAAARVKAANPAALYCCDPVIGDVGRGVFVRPGIPEFMRDRALPAADILTPNQFELEWLTGQPVTTLAEAKAAVATLQAAMAPGGPRCVLLTSLKVAETPEDQIEMLAAEGGEFSRIRTPMLPLSVNGAGDAIAALFLFHRLKSGRAADALGAAASSIYGLLRRTSEAASREILTVAAQEEFVAPSRVFLPESC
ncbi:pyridoxal kinase PdxY [Pseudoroseomonas cervicalis]|uniref:pyridoxal kinase PdxY n=1 Tax=Teichococcus cervicalis TaxID=204525 RepID=UPI00277EB986|nr:pyridoxal kinase PdxY [Pseudoroseomonas cervicalis]MDQ1079758.1 pyridoxine kinase [Pseudoroseomonas cervicalis]